MITNRDDYNGCDPSLHYTVSISEDLLQADKLGEWAIECGQADQCLFELRRLWIGL